MEVKLFKARRAAARTSLILLLERTGLKMMVLRVCAGGDSPAVFMN